MISATRITPCTPGRESDFLKKSSSRAYRGTSNYFAPNAPLLTITALLGSAVALTACSSAVTPDKMSQIKPAMNSDQVQSILGRPTRIEQSETADQTLNGEVDYYTAANGEGRVTFINHTVFKAEFVPSTKS